MSIRIAIVSQFERPRGFLGRIVGWVLSRRGSNLVRNRWTVDLLDPMSGERVLEVGCGPGVALELCLSRMSVQAVGVDHSALMVTQAGRRNVKAMRAGRLALIEGTINDVPSDLAPFDKLFSINVIQFVEQAVFVSHAKRLLKPGGLFAATYQPRHAKATRQDALAMAARLSALLSEAGFSETRVEEIDLRPVPAICVIARRGVSGDEENGNARAQFAPEGAAAAGAAVQSVGAGAGDCRVVAAFASGLSPHCGGRVGGDGDSSQPVGGGSVCEGRHRHRAVQ